MRIGVDLGGTKIEAVLLDRQGGEQARRRIPTPQGDYAGTISAIASLVSDMTEAAANQAPGVKSPVGIGIPGAISTSSGLVKNANSTWLIGKPFEQDLNAALNRPLRLANDANCFAVSEATDGAAAGADMVFGVILGTGVGGGLVHYGQIITGTNAIAGEWGHNPLPWPEIAADGDERPGHDCYCGLHGCLETFLCGAGLGRSYHALGGDGAVDAPVISQRAEAGDQSAQRALELYAGRLARGLAAVINLLDPQIIVLGGGLSNMDDLYRSVPALWGRWIFSDEYQTKLVKNMHGDSSGVRGAAMLWPAETAEKDG